MYIFWDKDSKQRLKMFKGTDEPGRAQPITCSTFNRDGTIFAYALSYDWSKVGGAQRGSDACCHCATVAVAVAAGATAAPAAFVASAAAVAPWRRCTAVRRSPLVSFARACC